MALPAPLAQAVSTASERLVLIESITDNFIKDLQDIAVEMVADVTQAIAAQAEGEILSAAVLAQSVSVIDMSAILQDSEFDEVVESFLFRYQEVLNLTAKHMSDAGFSPTFFSTDLSLLTALAEMDDARWTLISQEMAAVTREAILRSAFLGASLSDVAQTISESVGSTIAKATNQARTMIMAYARQSTALLGERANVGWYMYVGPSDGLNRPFCRHLVGKVLKASDVKNLSNGQIDPPLVHGGGYNCRHHWAPVPDPQLVVDYKDEHATPNDLARAQSSGGAGGPSSPVADAPEASP